MLCTSLLFALGLASVSSALPNPARSNDLTPRSYPSGSYTCYYSCPESNGVGSVLTSKQDLSGYFGTPAYLCSYNSGNTATYCIYNGNDGSFNQGSGTNCDNQAPFAGCTTTGPPNEDTDFRKRALPRRKTAVEERVAARQYKPKKVDSKA